MPGRHVARNFRSRDNQQITLHSGFSCLLICAIAIGMEYVSPMRLVFKVLCDRQPIQTITQSFSYSYFWPDVAVTKNAMSVEISHQSYIPLHIGKYDVAFTDLSF